MSAFYDLYDSVIYMGQQDSKPKASDNRICLYVHVSLGPLGYSFYNSNFRVKPLHTCLYDLHAYVVMYMLLGDLRVWFL